MTDTTTKSKISTNTTNYRIHHAFPTLKRWLLETTVVDFSASATWAPFGVAPMRDELLVEHTSEGTWRKSGERLNKLQVRMQKA